MMPVTKKEQKYIKSLQQKKYRLREKRFLVEGAKSVLELLHSDISVEVVLCTQAFYHLGILNDFNIRKVIVPPSILVQLGTFRSNDAALAVGVIPESTHSVDCSESVFFLDGIRDPSNFGSILRTLDWFGFKQLGCSQDCADMYDPKVITSSMGSFTRVKVAYIDLYEYLLGINSPIFVASNTGTRLDKIHVPSSAVLVMGNESQGTSKAIKSLATECICIPQYGKAESLNVGVATGIIAHYLRLQYPVT